MADELNNAIGQGFPNSIITKSPAKNLNAIKKKNTSRFPHVSSFVHRNPTFLAPSHN